MAWNLVDELSDPLQPRRRFFVPLASIPVGQNAVRAIDRTLYSLSETYTPVSAADQRTADVSLNIQIQIPAAGLADENGNPDPLIRLHAIDKARIHFEPAGGGMQNRLVLEMLTFVTYFLGPQFPKWFDRWVDAQSIPLVVIFENVDQGQLQNLLNSMAAPVDTLPEHRVEPTNGLSFPLEVVQANKAEFITEFLAGNEFFSIIAEAGTVVGTAAIDPANAAQRLLKLHARYQDHTDANPHPMNPRELFYLLFGNDSDEAQNHPFLGRFDEVAQAVPQTNIQPESKRMWLRPPLRTWARVGWEASQEIGAHQADWEPAGNLGTNRFYNDHSRQVGGVNRSFNDGNYNGANKCNLFVSDICLRAGFRVSIHPVGGNRWHYMDANSYTNNIHPVGGADDRTAVMGANDDVGTHSAWKIENGLRAQAAADRQQYLNNLMQVEGRCLILSGARARKFVQHTVVAGVQGIANCTTALRNNGIGHIVIVSEVLAEPQLVATVGDGLNRIQMDTWQASGSGAVHQNFTAQLGGAAGAAAGGNGFIRLHLFELDPGGDPDTVQGLRSLNVQNVNRNLLGTPNEAAANAPITHNPAGAPLKPGNCCHDNYPPSNAAPTTVVC